MKSSSPADRSRRRVAVVAACSALCWSCGESSPPPIAPSVQTVVSLSITAPPQLKRGDALQLVAMATLSDGRSVAVTRDITWASSDVSVATINNGGLLTAVSDGTAVITATYSGHSANATLRVRTGGRTLNGIVTESVPTESKPVAGARIEVTGGVYADATAVTDANGAFSLADVDGGLDLRVTRADFEDAVVRADVASGAVMIRLVPVLRMVTDIAEWRGRNSPPERVADGRLIFHMHHAGTVRIRTESSLYYSDSASSCTELRDDSRMILEERSSWQMPVEKTLSLAGGKTYELRIVDCGGPTTPGGATMSYFRLVATHPS